MDAFTSLAVLQIPSPSRLLASACCPDKDLVVLISRLGGEDRLSLWNYSHGSKVWEVNIGSANGTNIAEIVDLAWSPDGQSIAIIHDPPQITLHSLQDGQKLATLSISQPPNNRSCHVIGVWWFREEKPPNTSSIPDIFKRDGTITGTAHSILKILPLLDSLQEDSQKLTATDLFAFQGSQTRTSSKSLFPDAIKMWPMLPSDLLAASISPSSQNSSTKHNTKENPDDVDNSNVNSILAVTDDLGRIHCFLDGHFPLGSVHLRPNLSTMSLLKHPKNPIFFAHLSTMPTTSTVTSLRPVIIDLPLLGERYTRDLAKLSSTARELMWYILRVVKEMRSTWFGADGFPGARELGPKWVQALEEKQKDQFGQEEPNPILDLTALLVTGRATDALLDFLGSGEQMSERGIQKWEATVTEALMKLRDFSEKRLAPACQRLHLVLEELQGCSQLSQYALFELSPQELEGSLELLHRAIIIAAWLAANARRELSRFKEFISWVRFETSAANPNNDASTSPRFDILEVNNYFISGLQVSAMDKFFTGPVPRFSLQDLGASGDSESGSIADAIKRARALLNDPAKMAWKVHVPQPQLNHFYGNVDALVQELATRCRKIFDRAAGAASRSAKISPNNGGDPISDETARSTMIIKERTLPSEGEEFTQYLATSLPSEQSLSLCITRLCFSRGGPEQLIKVDVALLESNSPTEDESFELMGADFFDSENAVIVYRTRSEDKPAFLATFNYTNLEYLTLPADEHSKVSTREDLMLEVVRHWKEGNLPSTPIPIKRCRALTRFPVGMLTVALNGRTGRKVACVLDNKGTTLESFDLEEAEDTEDDGETP